MGVLNELRGRVVLIEWYRSDSTWHHFRVLDFDSAAQWIKLQGLPQVEDGQEVPYHGSPLWTPLDEIRSLTEHGPEPKQARKGKKPSAAAKKRRLNGTGKPLPVSSRGSKVPSPKTRNSGLGTRD